MTFKSQKEISISKGKIFVKDIFEEISSINNKYQRSFLKDRALEPVGKFLSFMLYEKYIAEGSVFSINNISKEVGSPIGSSLYVLSFIYFIRKLDELSLEYATEGRVLELTSCISVVDLGFEVLSDFSFRNGVFRLSFDGIKYVRKNIQTRLYEVKLFLNIKEEAPTKKLKTGLDRESVEKDFSQLVKEMDREDEYRESVIKATRDVQKGAKRAIYKAHQKDYSQAERLIKEAVGKLKLIKEREENPDYLYSIYAYLGCIEELGEALLTVNWMLHIFGTKEEKEKYNKSLMGKERVLSYSELEAFLESDVSLNIYLGALSDFTGEIGRDGVTAAGNRQLEVVKSTVSTMEVVQSASLSLFKSHLPLKFQEKKLSQIDTNLQKMKKIYCEQYLVQRREVILLGN